MFIHEAYSLPNFYYIRLSSVYICLVGFTYYSITSLYAYFWLLYTLHLFLRIASPLRMAQLEQSKHAQIIHSIEITFVVLLATVPYIVFASQEQFHIVSFPPLYCGAGPSQNFYSNIVPTILATCASLIMMVIMMYKIHIVSC